MRNYKHVCMQVNIILMMHACMNMCLHVRTRKCSSSHTCNRSNPNFSFARNTTAATLSHIKSLKRHLRGISSSSSQSLHKLASRSSSAAASVTFVAAIFFQSITVSNCQWPNTPGCFFKTNQNQNLSAPPGHPQGDISTERSLYFLGALLGNGQ